MKITVIYEKEPVFRRAWCPSCLGPIKHAARGRPRQFCSHACRQRYYRERTWIDDFDRQARKRIRRTERPLRRWERAHARVDDTPIAPGLRISQRSNLQFGLRFGLPLEFCQWCARPMLRHTGRGSRRRCCSESCRVKFTAFTTRLGQALTAYDGRFDPLVALRLRQFDIHAKKPQPVLRLEVNVCAHCGVPFAATHPARKYCSKRCRQNAWCAARKVCARCKRRFRPDRKNGWKQKYCSRRCWERAVIRKPPLAIPRICPECGSPFIANRRNYTTKMYCSHRCTHRVSLRNFYARKRAEQRRLAEEFGSG